MSGRVQMTIRTATTDGLDYYPTQPWVTRALLERIDIRGCQVWEPACGGGHISEVLLEDWDGGGFSVASTDVHDYGYAMLPQVDFMAPSDWDHEEWDWIITNPPFQDKLSERFTEKALRISKNVAMLCRLSWLEGMDRHARIFGPTPPSRVIVLTERVGFEKETCTVGKKGMIPYAWFVWEEGKSDTRLEWAGRGTMARLTRDTDAEKFNGRVVKCA